MKRDWLKIKTELINVAAVILKDKIDQYEIDIRDAQHEANQFKGAMESRYDTFKEELQERKKNLQIQQGKTKEYVALLNSIKLVENKLIGIGAVVKTRDEMMVETNYFIFSSITTKPINILDNKYYFLSIESPIGEILKGKTIGDKIQFRNKAILVVDIF